MTLDSQDCVFEQLIPAILDWEGGDKVVNSPDDPGGKTKYGISTNACKDALLKLHVKDVADLTEDQARRIYFEHYWLPSGADEIPDNGLALVHFDAAINHGVGAAKEMLAALSKVPGHFAGGGLNKGLFNQLCIEYVAMRLHRYSTDKNRKANLEGWVNRMTRVMGAIKRLCDDPAARLT